MQHCDCSVPEQETEKHLGSAENTFHSDLADQAGFSTLNSLLQTHYLGLAKTLQMQTTVFLFHIF